MNDNFINGYDIYHGFLSGFKSITTQRQYLNKINVFPVADGDTGNNLVKTVKMIVNNLESSKSATAVLQNIAELSLHSARGNSGMILSQYLNGLAIHTESKDRISIDEFAVAAKKSVEMAYSSLENPVEGTILTVLKEWSNTIYDKSQEDLPVCDIFKSAFEKATESLEETKEKLLILKENNVLDAGAYGFVSFLKGLESFRVNGPLPNSFRRTLKVEQIKVDEDLMEDIHNFTEYPQYRYCTEMLLNHRIDKDQKLKENLKKYGDSLIINKGVNKTRIHLHTNTPNIVAKEMKKYGSVSEHKVDDMVLQYETVNNKKSSVAVVTDSIADIPRESLDGQQIHVLNIKLLWDDDEFLDRLTITSKEFYKEQKSRKSFPGSSVPEKARVDALYQYLTDNYESVIVLPVSKSLSGTYNIMSKVADEYNKDKRRISVIDTSLNSVAQGLLVIEIAKLANEGKTLDELEVAAIELKKRIKIYVSVNTFKYMVKGGRVSPLKGFIATLLNLKPIVSLDENGKGKAFDKAFSRKGLLKKIKKIISDTKESKGIISYAIVHGDDKDIAEKFSKEIGSSIDMTPQYITSISPVIGMHSGQGAIAIGVIEAE